MTITAILNTSQSARPRALAWLGVMGLILALLGPFLPSPAVAAPAPTQIAPGSSAEPPVIERSVGDAGFAHPGVGVTADHLETMRENVLAGVEPWASYFAAMAETRYASPTYVAENVGDSDDSPASDAYDNAGMRSRALRDGIGAMTQSLMYVVTGEEVYRANALKAIRAWSSMDPGKYQYFADAHIHTGDPLYKMLIAAEIIRSTTPVNDDLDGYDLRWSERDEQRIEDNLIRPILETFLYSQNRLWNQHLYGVIGAVAAGIFLDDAELYAERVEWFTVNAGYESEHTINGGDVNGALASVFRVIEADDPLNPYGFDFVQHLEMGRDQAHAEGDVDIFAALARIVHNQGTLLDPVHGTVSTASDAVTAYEFLDHRILAGADVFAAFMMGEDVPYIDTSGGAGKLSQAYRGRLVDALGELYYQYRYVAGVDVAEEAPYVAEAFEHRDGPTYYYGNGVGNFWNERGSDFNGAEYWVAFPAELAQEDVEVSGPAGPELDVAQFGHPLGDGATREIDGDGTSYVRLDSDAGRAQLAVRRGIFPSRADTALVGFHIRTTEHTVLRVSPTESEAQAADITVPNTHGQWRYVTLDIAQTAFPVSPVGHHIVFLTAPEGVAPVEVADVLADANGVLTPPVFTHGNTVDLVAVAGEELAVAVPVTGDGDLDVELQGEPAGATLNADGLLTWRPTTSDLGTASFVVRASDGVTDSAAAVTIEVTDSREAAIEHLMSGLAPEAAYTRVSWVLLREAHSEATDAVDTAEDAEFQVLLATLQEARGNLELLNPQLDDGTLDYSGMVSAAGLGYTTLLALTDGENQTTWGDQRVREIVFDFGSGYRVQADAFGFLARDTFPNRAEGTNVYGSNNALDWTLLTERPNSGDDVAIETIPVIEDERDTRYRFLKLQMDEPGVPSDPAYPGIWTLADFRISGERSEAVGSLDSVSISAPDSIAGRAVPGDRIEVQFTGPEGLTDIAVTIAGQDAEVEEVEPGEWVASIVLGAYTEPDVAFSIDFATPDGQDADPVEATSDGSRIFVSSDENLLDNAFASADVVGPDGLSNPTLAGQAAQIFDGNPSSHSDVRAIDGVIALTWDFGEGSNATLSGAELLVRQDGYGISRISNMRIEGSDDRENWTRLTPAVPQGTLDWQRWSVTANDGFRYIRLINGEIMGIAELRLFGAVELDLDVLLEKAAAEDLSGYSRGSALEFTREVDAVRAAAEAGEPSQELAQRLLDAWGLLVSPPVAVQPIEQDWVRASSRSWDGRLDEAANGWAMFDDNPATFTDTTQAAGWVTVIPTTDTLFAIDQVRALPRSGHESRAVGVQFQGSNDGGETWQTFAEVEALSSSSWVEISLDEQVEYGALRVLAPAGNTNLAEVQFVHRVVDVTALEIYISEAEQLDESDWTPSSWAALEAALEQAQEALSPDATQEAVDEASSVLAAAVDALIPAEPVDTTAPTVSVKEGVEFTVGSEETGYEMVSFKLFDEFQIDKVVINGVVKDLTDNQWSDVNFIKPGVFGAVLGENTMEVHDVAGNVTTLEFLLVEPGAEPGPEVPAWEAGQVYTAGDQVSHDGAVFVAQWWTQNQVPGSPTGAWAEVGALVPAAGEDVRAWTASWVYTGGETVAYDGHTWRAKWWTRNQVPGDVHGPWEDLGQY